MVDRPGSWGLRGEVAELPEDDEMRDSVDLVDLVDQAVDQTF